MYWDDTKKNPEKVDCHAFFTLPPPVYTSISSIFICLLLCVFAEEIVYKKTDSTWLHQEVMALWFSSVVSRINSILPTVGTLCSCRHIAIDYITGRKEQKTKGYW